MENIHVGARGIVTVSRLLFSILYCKGTGSQVAFWSPDLDSVKNGNTCSSLLPVLVHRTIPFGCLVSFHPDFNSSSWEP